MYFKVSHELIWIYSLLFACDSIGISDKLDFNDDQPSIIKTHDSLNKFPGSSSTYKTVKTYEKSGGNFDDIGVVCVSGGCNSTKDGSRDRVETDVVVHVKTKVDLSNSKVNDTPDIPVVVGYQGTNFDSSSDDLDRPLNVQPLVISDIEEELNRPHYSTTISPYGTTSRSFTSNSFIPRSNLSPFSTLSPINTYSTSVYGAQTESSPYTPGSLYGEPRVDINIKSLPPVSLTSDLNRNILKENNFNLDTSGFNLSPIYGNSRNYYNTNPPRKFQQWYPNDVRNFQKSSINQHNYQNSWDRQVPTYHRHSSNGMNTCICKNEPGGTIVNGQWFPSTNNNNNRRVSNDDPGSQINDKLAPLN